MKTLGTLIKLQKSLVDDQRRMLADLQNILERIEAEIVALDALRNREEEVARTAEPAAMVTLAQFMAQPKNRAEQLAKAKRDAIAAVEAAREQLAELFETQKRYEIIRDQRDAAALAEEKRQDRLELDEIAETSHQRKQGEE